MIIWTHTDTYGLVHKEKAPAKAAGALLSVVFGYDRKNLIVIITVQEFKIKIWIHFLRMFAQAENLAAYDHDGAHAQNRNAETYIGDFLRNVYSGAKRHSDDETHFVHYSGACLFAANGFGDDRFERAEYNI